MKWKYIFAFSCFEKRASKQIAWSGKNSDVFRREGTSFTFLAAHDIQVVFVQNNENSDFRKT